MSINANTLTEYLGDILVPFLCLLVYCQLHSLG